MKQIKYLLIIIIILLLWASPVMGIEFDDLPEFSYEIGQIKNEPAQNNIEPEKPGFWASRDPWTKQDTYWQIGVLVTQIIDWGQTRDMSKQEIEYYWVEFVRYRKDPPYEKNPILGENPTTQEVDRYFIVCIISNYLIARALPTNWRRKWQAGSILYQLYFVKNNYKLGLKVRF